MLQSEIKWFVTNMNWLTSYVLVALTSERYTHWTPESWINLTGSLMLYFVLESIFKGLNIDSFGVALKSVNLLRIMLKSSDKTWLILQKLCLLSISVIVPINISIVSIKIIKNWSSSRIFKSQHVWNQAAQCIQNVFEWVFQSMYASWSQQNCLHCPYFKLTDFRSMFDIILFNILYFISLLSNSYFYRFEY